MGINLNVNPFETFSYEYFAQLSKQDIQLGLDYIKTFETTEDIIAPILVTKTTINTDKEKRLELKAKLDIAGVKYFPGSKIEKLLELCKANNIV